MSEERVNFKIEIQKVRQDFSQENKFLDESILIQRTDMLELSRDFIKLSKNYQRNLLAKKKRRVEKSPISQRNKNWKYFDGREHKALQNLTHSRLDISPDITQSTKLRKKMGRVSPIKSRHLRHKKLSQAEVKPIYNKSRDQAYPLSQHETPLSETFTKVNRSPLKEDFKAPEFSPIPNEEKTIAENRRSSGNRSRQSQQTKE